MVKKLEILQKVHQKYLGSFEMWCSRRMKEISWVDRVKNELLRSQGGNENPTYNKKEER
jgi:hypothetical protein